MSRLSATAASDFGGWAMALNFISLPTQLQGQNTAKACPPTARGGFSPGNWLRAHSFPEKKTDANFQCPEREMGLETRAPKPAAQEPARSDNTTGTLQHRRGEPRVQILHRVLGRPLPRRGVVPGAVRPIDLRDLRHQRVVRIRVGEERADGQQDLREGQGGAPLVLQDVEADTTVRVDVAVVDLRREVHLRGLEGIVRGEVDVQELHAAAVRGLIRAQDGRLPVEEVVAHGAGRAVGRGIIAEVLELAVDPLEGHFEKIKK